MYVDELLLWNRFHNVSFLAECDSRVVFQYLSLLDKEQGRLLLSPSWKKDKAWVTVIPQLENTKRQFSNSFDRYSHNRNNYRS